MTKRKPLEWHSDDDLLGYPLCPDCFTYMTQPGMLEACASVGIEHDKSTGQLMREMVDAFHARKHKELGG